MKKLIYFGILFTSCSLAPKYESPKTPQVTQWRTTLSSDDSQNFAWWKNFGDQKLDQLITLALKNNQNIQSAIAKVDQFMAQVGIVESKLYPQLNLEAIAQNIHLPTTTTFFPAGVPSTYNLYGYRFQASYLADIWGEVRNASKEALENFYASIEMRRIVVMAIVTSITKSYIRLRQYDRQLEISKLTLGSRQEALFQAKARFELGLSSFMEVEQAASEKEIAKVAIDQLQLKIAETENLISFLVSEPSHEIIRGKTIDQLRLPPKVPSYLPSELSQQRPDLRRAEHLLKSANANIGVARARFFPQISLVGDYGGQSIKLLDILKSPSRAWEYGANILQEIFTGGKLTSGLFLSKAQKQELLHNYFTTIYNAFREINDALIAHKIDLQLIEDQQRRVRDVRGYLHLANLRYKEGQTDYLTFLDAERQFFQSQLDYEEARGNSFISLITLYEALGGNWVLEADHQALKNRH